HGVFKVIFYLPSIIGGTVTATLYRKLLSEGAPLYELLYKMHFITEEMAQLSLFGHESTGFLMVIIYSIWTCVGINMIMFYGAMKRIPQEIFESAEIDGVGFFRQFTDIVVPLIWPTISTLIIFSLSGMFVSYGAVMILTPSLKQASMIGWYIVHYTTATDNHASYNYPAAVGLIFTIVGLPFVLFVRWLLNKISANVEY
ncbi:MAG: sugar ABC transporter permease, partial [Bacilli bacterium]|nr:sugar ABC transporter permease [Bacilli bacterium]